MVWGDSCQVSKVSKKDLQDQQREYSPQAHSEPASTISGSATIFCTTRLSRQPIYTSYTSIMNTLFRKIPEGLTVAHEDEVGVLLKKH